MIDDPAPISSMIPARFTAHGAFGQREESAEANHDKTQMQQPSATKNTIRNLTTSPHRNAALFLRSFLGVR
jgi:hypothetical protein